MDKSAAIAIAAAMPLLSAVFYFSTRIFPAFWGYGAALAFYWVCVLVPLIVWRGTWRRMNMRIIFPRPWLAILNFALVAGVAIAAFVAFSQNPIPLWVICIVAFGALMNGTLEEAFWRGTLLQNDATPKAQLGQLGLFTGWHVALLFASGVTVTGGPLALLGGAAFAGALWTVARMQTGSVGFGIVCHIALNLFAFTELAARNFT